MDAARGAQGSRQEGGDAVYVPPASAQISASLRTTLHSFTSSRKPESVCTQQSGRRPSETRAVGLAEVEAAAMRAQALAVSSSPSDTKAVRVEPEPPLPLLVASSPSETAAVPAEEAASPLLFFSQEGAEAEAEVVAVAEATAAAEQQQLEEEPPQPDIVSDMLLMNGDGF